MPEVDIFGGLSGFSLGLGKLHWIIWVEIFLFIIIVLFLVIFLMYKHRTYIIFKDSLGYRRMKMPQWTRIIQKKDGQRYLDFMFMRRRIVDKNYKPVAGGFGLKYFLFEDKTGNFHQYEMDEPSEESVYKVKAIPREILSTQVALLHQLNQDHQPKSWFEKYATIIVPLVTIGVLAFVIIYSFEKITEMQSTAASTLRQVAEIQAEMAKQSVVAK